MTFKKKSNYSMRYYLGIWLIHHLLVDFFQLILLKCFLSNSIVIYSLLFQVLNGICLRVESLPYSFMHFIRYSQIFRYLLVTCHSFCIECMNQNGYLVKYFKFHLIMYRAECFVCDIIANICSKCLHQFAQVLAMSFVQY